jgi:Protein of unknown function (DUF3551)
MRIPRLAIVALAALVLPAALAASSARAYERPYDPYPWCAAYGGDMSGVSNCGFLTWEQCMATVSGVGGTCEHNQFYNPGNRSARYSHRRHRTYRR